MAEVLDTITPRSLLESAAILGGFLAFLFVGSRLVPGRTIQGVELEDGTRKSYTLNGLWLFLLSLGVAGLGQWQGWWSLSGLVERFAPLFVVTNVFAFGLTFLLWLQGKDKPGADRDPKGGLGGVLRELFMGVELNPTWWKVDLKMFSYRPSLIGLAMFNLGFAVLQVERHGELSTAMMLYQAFTLTYVFNYFQFEYGMVFTWDVIAENFGWMLIWGDYAFLPYLYCISGWFLVDATGPMHPAAVAGLVGLFLFGFWLFRGANEQKHRFKMDRSARIWGRPAETVGGRLLVSGFWGIGRHLNYTGEICIYLAFTATTGFDSWVPWILPAWLISLLVHRAWRDDQRCRAKYGDLWDAYTARARFKMIPFLY
ncbi:MAG: DUF1295 domain-containing protein [Myxococcota bacterium]